MKIHQLPLGARFEYEGEEYVKTGPLFGTSKNGGQRLIPRYAVLTVAGDEAAAVTGKGEPLSRAAVRKAVEGFYADCRRLVPADSQAELGVARERLMKALGLSH